MEIFDPGQLAEAPQLSDEDKLLLSELPSTSVWQALLKLWKWQEDKLMAQILFSQDNPIAYRDILKGFILARKLVNDAVGVYSSPEPKLEDREKQFYEKVSKKI